MRRAELAVTGMRTPAERGALRRRAVGGTPMLVTAVAALGFAVFVILPLIALAQRTPWSSLGDLLGSAEVRDALRISMIASTSAAVLATVLGVPLAWVLARVDFPGRGVVRALVLVPLVLPPVVGGVALLLAFGRRGMAGQWLDQWFGVRLAFTVTGSIVAATFVALPFLVITVEAAIRRLDRSLEEAAATLGAHRIEIWRRITLPAIAPALAAGIALAWARALGEFGATVTFAGNVAGRTQTMPLAVFQALETDPDAAIALSLVLLSLSIVVLVIAGRYALGMRTESR